MLFRSRLVRSLTKVARYVCSSPPLRIVLARNGFFALFVSAIPTLLPVIALRDLELEPARLGLLFTLMSTGSVAASLFLSGWALQRFSSNSILLGGKILLVLIYLGAAWGVLPHRIGSSYPSRGLPGPCRRPNCGRSHSGL